MMASTTVANSMGDVAVCVGDDDSSIKRRWGTMAMATHPSTGDDEGMATRMAASTMATTMAVTTANSIGTVDDDGIFDAEWRR